MSRSVETIGKNIIYFDCSQFDNDGYDWNDLIVNLQSELLAKYKSLVECKKKWANYPYRENMIILENYHVQISISEYCGCGAVSVFINTKYENDKAGILAESWLSRNYAGIREIVSKYCTVLNRIATFSNGEAVFEEAK
jgi:hypothetical protein